MEGTSFVHDALDRQEREVMPASARQYLLNGVTTVRDLGSPLSIVRVRDRIRRGEIPGARLFVAGPMLHKLPSTAVEHRCRGVLMQHGARLFVAGPMLHKHPSTAMLDRSWDVSGPEDARKKVRELVAA